MPRWPPGTTSKRRFGTRSSIGRTELTGAMVSPEPPKASTGTVMSANEMSRPSKCTVPSASSLPRTMRW